LAVPLLLYLVGLAYLDDYPPDFLDHLVIGTTALSVGLNAYIKRVHWRRGNVKVKTGAVFAAVGALGNLAGANAGLVVHGHLVLFLLSIFMNRGCLHTERGLRRGWGPRFELGEAWPTAFAVGFASGFFGIGGGSSWCPVCSLAPASTSSAVGISLISAGIFCMMTAATYMWRGFVEPVLSMLYLVGGTAGGYISARIAY